MTKTPKVDDIDKSILRQLQRDAQLSYQELGERVGVSRSSAQRRVQILRDTGVISKDVSVINARHGGGLMTFIVEVELERERVDLLDEFRRSMLQLDNVQQCYYVTGHTDFVLIVLAQDMTAYEIFTRRVFTENPNIKRFHTNVVVEPVKVGMSVPI